ncbi:hypothetical protein pb186bvf_002755 [Paramecium bursaria]
MCLPLKFLRQITRSIVYIVSGFGFVIFTICLFIPQSVAFGACMGCYLQSIAFCGYRGQKTRNIFCIFCFNCQLWCTYIIIFVFSALIIALKEGLQVYQMNMEIMSAESYFCQNDCVCYIQPDVQWPDNYLQNYSYSTQNSNLPYNFQGCSQFTQDDGQTTAYLKQMEIDQRCSGISDMSPIYLFSNVSQGVPRQKCEPGLFLLSQHLLYLIIYGIILIFFISMCLLSCCICCNPQNKKSNDRIYPYIKYKYGEFELVEHKIST